jgi:hypothetical protein
MLRPMLLALALTGCAAGQPPSGTALGPDLAEARRLLLASDAPIPVEVVAAPASLGSRADSIAASAASRATQWAAASFTPATGATPAGPWLALEFGEGAADPGAPCGGMAGSPPVGTDPTRLVAVLCEGSRPVAEAIGRGQGTDRAATETLITETTARLFPRVGGQEGVAGWSPWAPGVSLGGWVGSGGGSGVGVGLGF